jgi:hypothetical protein
MNNEEEHFENEDNNMNNEEEHVDNQNDQKNEEENEKNQINQENNMNFGEEGEDNQNNQKYEEENENNQELNMNNEEENIDNKNSQENNYGGENADKESQHENLKSGESEGENQNIQENKINSEKNEDNQNMENENINENSQNDNNYEMHEERENQDIEENKIESGEHSLKEEDKDKDKKNIKKNNIIEKLNEILDVLYKKEIPLDAKDIYGNTPLHYAAKNLFKEFIEFILNKYKDKQYLLNIENNENHTPFYLATKDNNINLINKDIFDLLFTTKNINQINLLDESLIDKNKNVVKKKHFKEDNYKCSLLLYIIRLMLNNQANDNYKYFYQKLIQNGASLMERDSYGKSALIYTVIENNFPFLKMLCDSDNKNKDLYKNIIDVTNKKSLVHYCVSLNNFGSYENKEMLIYLLDNNFIFSTKDMTNKTPLEYALEQKSLNNLIILKNKKVTGTENINLDEIKKNYKKLIHLNHPDKGGKIEEFLKIQNAFKILNFPLTKKIFDKFGTISLPIINDILILYQNNNYFNFDEIFKAIDNNNDLESINYLIHCNFN